MYRVIPFIRYLETELDDDTYGFYGAVKLRLLEIYQLIKSILNYKVF